MALFKNKKLLFGLSAALSAVLGGVGAWLTNQMIAQRLGEPEGPLPEYVPPSKDGSTSPRPAEGIAALPEMTASQGTPSQGGDGAGDAHADAATTDAGAGDPEAPASPEGPAAQGGDARQIPTSFDPVVQRNIFNSEAVGRMLLAAQAPTEEGEEPSSPSLAPLCVYVIGTLEASPARYSWAIMARDKNNTDKDIYRIGDDVFGGGTLASVRRLEVDVRRPDGSTQTFKVKEECSAGGATMPSEAPAATDAQVSADGGEGIQQTGENQFTIDKAEIEKAMNNVEQLSKDARIVPHYQNGEVIGYKVFRIKPGSAYSKLGLRNGDIITSVNGQSLDSTEKALALYQTFKNQSNFNIEVRRRNQPVTMSYVVK